MRIMAALLFAFAGIAFAGQNGNFEQEFPVAANPSFSLQSHKGKITIRTDNGSTIRVKARIYAEDAPADIEQQIINATEIKVSSGDTWVRIDVDYEDIGSFTDKLFNRNNYGVAFVDFDIILPDDADLNLTTHKSDVDINAPAGRISIESHKGNGPVRNVRGDLDLQTHKGNFDIEIVELHDVDVNTHKGDVFLHILHAADFQVRGDTHKGDMKFKGRDIRLISEDRGGTVHYTEGRGSNRISLDTHKGLISLDFKN